MSGLSEAWLRWRLGEQGDEAREWAEGVVGGEHRSVLARAGRRLHGLSAAVASGPGHRDTENRLSLVWKFLTSQKDRADKRGGTDDASFWQEVQEKLKALDKAADRILNRLTDEISVSEEPDNHDDLRLALIELYINTLLACWQAQGE